ncbi:SAV_915 family protein [Streptomyces sp. NPDC048106]|uniref:SAV_915 family protein n=1 Tax=Streptomyces sp. NPDC048106 TaxID=3155750 RepID=UPI003456B128
MAELRCGDDPAPPEPLPDGPLYVPVRPGPSGYAVRLFRTPLGERTAVGFTSVRRLTATLGSGQAFIRLAGAGLRTLIAPLGVTVLTVDPRCTAPAPRPRATDRTDRTDRPEGDTDTGMTTTHPRPPEGRGPAPPPPAPVPRSPAGRRRGAGPSVACRLTGRPTDRTAGSSRHSP